MMLATENRVVRGSAETRRRARRGPRGWATVVLAASVCLAQPARTEPVTIRVGWVSAISNLVSILFLKPGIARHEGRSYTLAASHSANAPFMVPALAIDQLDIATLTYSALALAIENARMTDLRVIADEFQDGVDGFYSNEFFVLKESPIGRIEDLKSKVLAVNRIDDALDMALRALMRKHGMEEERDFTVIEISSPEQKAALAARKAALVGSAPPFSQDPELRRMARALFTQRDAVGSSQMMVWVARQGFLQKNRAAIVDFLEDAIRARRYYTDPAHHREVVALAAQFTKQSAAAYESWLFTKSGDYYRDPRALPDLEALQRAIDVQRQLGFLRDPIDIRDYADLALVKEAAARLNQP